MIIGTPGVGDIGSKKRVGKGLNESKPQTEKLVKKLTSANLKKASNPEQTSSAVPPGPQMAPQDAMGQGSMPGDPTSDQAFSARPVRRGRPFLQGQY